MLGTEFKPTHRLVQQIARIERTAGLWERLSISEAIAPLPLVRRSLSSGAVAMLELDNTCPPSLSVLLRRPEAAEAIFSDGLCEGTEKVFHPALLQLIRAHEIETELTVLDVNFLHRFLLGGKDGALLAETRATTDHQPNYRKTAGYFSTLLGEPLFPTVPAFLIEQKLENLLSWTRREFLSAQIHPLFVVGTFHLLFLQLSPFSEANHRLCLLLDWQLLKKSYSFVQYSHFCPIFARRGAQYFSTLRQAERTAYSGNWSSLSIWLEFFLDCLIASGQELLGFTKQKVSETSLSSVQKRIVEVVRLLGSASREQISTETGINLSTVKYNLSILAARGHLKREGGGRNTSYSPV